MALEVLPVCAREVEGADEIRPGDVRLVNGVAGLVLRDWLKDDSSFIVCPVKPFPDNDDEEITGRCVFVEMDRREMGLNLLDGIFTDPDPEDPTRLNGAALPELGCTVFKEFIGKLLYRVFPEQLEKASFAFAAEFSDGDAEFDSDAPNSYEDAELMRRIQRESLRKELDSSPAYVFEPDGRVRVETEKEWKARLRRRARAEKRAAKLAARSAKA